MYLEPAPGEAGINNILKMAREGLRRDLTTALHKAAAHKRDRAPPGPARQNQRRLHHGQPDHPPGGGRPRRDARGAPVPGHPGGSAAPRPRSTAQPAALQAVAEADGPGTDADARIAALKQELRAKEEYLQTANEELETSNEELKSSNEEMQSVNEELQSTNEELETSKEELQSVNEELATVNAELQTKVADLSRANNDMNNLLAGTGIGTVFVDHQLRILRFTPAATQIINLIPSDVGRPVGHIVSNLVGYDRLVADVQAVLDTLVPKEVEVQTTDGQVVHDAHPALPHARQRDRGRGDHLCGHHRDRSRRGRRCAKPMSCSVWPWSCAMRTMPSPCRTWTAASWPGTRAR